MLNVVGRIVGALIQSATAFIFIKELLISKNRKIKFKDLFSINILAILILLIHNTEYSTINPIVIFIAIIFILFLIYRISLTKSILCSTAFMIILFLADLIVTIFLAGISTVEVVRESYIFLIIVNLIVGIITVSFTKIKAIREKIIEIIKELEKKDSMETITFIFLVISALSLMFYLFSKNYIYNSLFIVCIVGVVLFIMLTFIFFKEKYEKEIIINNYDQLFEYVKTFEEWIDNEDLNKHESKNQLATLRDMVIDNKKAVKYIDNIISERINLESKNTIKLKNIPKGGLKGLLFYKIVLAENENINLLIDISKNAYNILDKLTITETKTLCRLVGIFFDNAIEASLYSNQKKVSCEIYLLGDNLNIVISNTFVGTININEMNNKGYSTKGKDRGKGLYLAHKISDKDDMFKLENRIINNYYIQKIIIKKNTN